MSNEVRVKNKENNSWKRLKKGIIALVLVTVLVISFVVRINYINKKYPKVSEQEHQIGEKFSWQGFEITVTGYRTMNLAQIKEEWKDAQGDFSDEYDVIVASLDVKYNGEEASAKFPISNIKGQSKAWNNASSYPLLLALNGDTNCKKGETRTLYTAIGISAIQFSDSDWKAHDKREYQLVFQTYPELVYVKL